MIVVVMYKFRTMVNSLESKVRCVLTVLHHDLNDGMIKMLFIVELDITQQI